MREMMLWLVDADIMKYFVCSHYSLQAIRAKVGKARLTSKLFDCRNYTNNMEKLYFKMWKRYSDGKQPCHVGDF